MDVRDAVEADAGRLAELTGAPTDVMRNLVHDRTVRVAFERHEGDQREPSERTSGSERSERDASPEVGDVENEPGDPENEPEGADDERATAEDTEHILGFVSFDAKRETVHITQMEGTDAATRRLLEEPRRFAANEGMSVELLVASGNEAHRSVAEAVGFDEEGPGPRFGGTATVRYRLDP